MLFRSMRQVAAANVAPVLGPILIAVGVQLVKQVVIAFVKNRAVGVVNPLGRGGDVKNGVGGVGLSARGGCLDGRGRADEGFGGGFGPAIARGYKCSQQEAGPSTGATFAAANW